MGSLTGGLVLMIMMPVAGRLTASKVDPRLLIALGFIGTSLGLHIMTAIYLQIDFRTMVLLRILQVSSLPFIFIPISTLNYVGVPRKKTIRSQAYRTSRGISVAASELRF